MFLNNVLFGNNLEKINSIAIGIYSDGSLSPSATKIDIKFSGIINKSVAKSTFSGALFEISSILITDDFANNVLLIGLGEKDKIFSNFELEKLGAAIYKCGEKLDSELIVAIDSDDVKCEKHTDIALVAFGIMLNSWNFDKYKTKKTEKIEKKKLQIVSFVTEETPELSKSFSELKNIAEGIMLTRTMVSEPANVIFPKSMAEITKNELLPLGVEVEVLDSVEMSRLEMNALLGVAQGSSHEPQLVVMKWNGGAIGEKPLAFVGKGVTFDSGGISLKPSDGMHEMRCDMAGAGTVLGLMKTIALNKTPLNIVGIMGLVENMPSGSAQRPGDIVTSMSGQTIEVLNTDAEGRLVLADALWYTQSVFSPKIIIDLATLTGAIVVALGHEFAGLFSNCDELAENIKLSSEKTGEKVWRMPMTKQFDDGINSDIADMQNIGRSDVRAGGSTAAHFLKRFVNNVDWAHIDIAGVETNKKDIFISNGATGFGVHLLYDFLIANYIKVETIENA